MDYADNFIHDDRDEPVLSVVVASEDDCISVKRRLRQQRVARVCHWKSDVLVPQKVSGLRDPRPEYWKYTDRGMRCDGQTLFNPYLANAYSTSYEF